MDERILRQFPKNARLFIEKYGDSMIDANSMVIRKNPIQSGVEKVLDFISQGKYSEIKDRYAYDTMYHLRLDFSIENRNYMTEKTANIQFRNAVTNEDDEVLKISNPSIKFIDFVMNTIKKMKSNYFTYDAFTNNCQNYILNVLQSNSLITSDAKNFIYQPVDDMIKELPSYVKKFASLATKAGSYVDKGLQSLGLRGLKRGGRVIRSGRLRI
jgi:hypothetical protein